MYSLHFTTLHLIIGPEFYSKENTKPIFNGQKILAIHNIYNYQACLEVLKILKFRRPRLLYDTYTLSQRNNSTLLILPVGSNQFVYISSKLWNIAVKCISKDTRLEDIKLGAFKAQLKNLLLKLQSKYDEIEWYPNNFNLASLSGAQD